MMTLARDHRRANPRGITMKHAILSAALLLGATGAALA